MKIVVNRDYGGFGLTKAVFKELGIKWEGYGYLDNDALGIESDNYNAYRTDSRLIAAIEKVGIEESTAALAKLEIIDISDGIEWEIDNYDGIETVHEQHRSW